MIAAPPLLAGAVKVMTACLSPAVTESMAGAPGTQAVVVKRASLPLIAPPLLIPLARKW